MCASTTGMRRCRGFRRRRDRDAAMWLSQRTVGQFPPFVLSGGAHGLARRPHPLSPRRRVPGGPPAPPRRRRRRSLPDTARPGEAGERVCARRDPAFRRVNLEILGNTDPFLHAHVRPRYEWEPAALVGRPAWLYPPEHWTDPATALGPQHD